MDINELHAKLLAFEAKHDLGKHSYKGIHYWNMIRSILPVQIMENAGMGAYIQRKSRNRFFLQRLIALLKACCHNLLHRKSLAPAEILMVYGEQFKEVNGVPTNVFLDYIKTNHSVERTVITQNYTNASTYKKYPNAAFTQLWLTLVMRLYRWRILKLRKPERHFIENLEHDLNKEFGINMHRMERIIYSTLLYRSMYERHVRKLLKRVNPKLVILVDYGLIHNGVVCEECRLSGIPCAEMLHGLITKENVYYTPREPYFTPKYVFTFGDLTSDIFLEGAYCKPVAVGSPYRDIQMKRIGKCAPDENGVVFYSEPALMNNTGFIRRFNEIVKDRGYRVFIKLRPIDQAIEAKKYEELEKAGVALLNAHEDLYSIITSQMHHVGIYSTVLFEALTDHTHVYMIDAEVNQSIRRTFSRYNYFTTVSSPEELADKVMNPQVREKDITKFWKPDAVANISRAIDNILLGREP